MTPEELDDPTKAGVETGLEGGGKLIEGKEREKETPEEETTEEKETPEETTEEEKPEEKSKELQTALAQKDHWRGKAVDPTTGKTYKELLEEKSKEAPAKKPDETEDEWKDKTNFLLTNVDKHYTEEEFDHISTVAKRSGKSLEEAAKDSEDFVKFQRTKVAKGNKIPGPSSPSSPSTGEKGEAEQDKMSDEEHEKYEKQQLEKRGGSGV